MGVSLDYSVYLSPLYIEKKKDERRSIATILGILIYKAKLCVRACVCYPQPSNVLFLPYKKFTKSDLLV